MDWQNIADTFYPMACVLSVEKKTDGRPGAIRMVAGNRKYLDSLALAAGSEELSSTKKVDFVPQSEYTRYIPKDLNFEDVCYRCAILHEPVHNCVHAPRYPFDIMVSLVPMESDDSRLGYCIYTQVLVSKSDDNLMSLNISKETAMEIIGTCIKLREDKPFEEILREVVQNIREICGAEYCCVLLMDDTQRKCSVLGESIAPGSPLARMETYLNDDFYALAETWMDTISGSFCLVVRNQHDMDFVRERNPAWYRSLEAAGVHRLVLFPLITRGQLLGYIYCSNFPEENTHHIRDTLELTTYFIASEIANNRFIEQLKSMSQMDLLTGVMNRNAMNSRIAGITEGKESVSGQIGIVFTDLNGLKYVNDHLGHQQGDAMLKNAAMILKSTFSEDEIYRAGGDEFLILVHDSTESNLQKKIASIKKKSRLFENVSFAAGYSLPQPGTDLRDALSLADARMYEDKENYYQLNPKMRRK